MKKKYIIGIDLGGTNLKIALLGLDCRIKSRSVLKTERFDCKEKLIAAIAVAVSGIIESRGINRKEVLGVGIGLPGPVDTEKGIVHFFPNIPGWSNVPLKKILEKELDMPVSMDNDANLMALAESRSGAARGFKNAVCITLGTGVGAGIIIDGRLFRGSTFSAGELGHMPVNENGPMCGCSGMACLESYIGNRKIIKDARAAFKRDISLEELSGLAMKNNPKAVRIWSAVGNKLGIVLSSVINLLNPDCIVIGGGVANAGSVLFDSVKETVLTRAMVVQARHVKILKAGLGNEAGMIGAALLVKGE